MALYPAFNKAKREEVPSYIQAEIYQNKLENDAKAYNKAQRDKMISAVPSAVKGGTEFYQSFDVVDPETGETTRNKMADYFKKNFGSDGGVGGTPEVSGQAAQANALRAPADSGVADAFMAGGTPDGFAGAEAFSLGQSAPTPAGLGASPMGYTPGVEGALADLGAANAPGFASAAPAAAGEAGISTATTMAPEAISGILGAGEGAAAAGTAAESIAAGTAAAQGAGLGSASALGAGAAGTAGAVAPAAATAGGATAAATPALAAMGPYGWAALAALAAYGLFS